MKGSASETKPKLTIQNLPVEIFDHVLSHLPSNNAGTLGQTNRYLNQVVNHSYVWKSYLKRLQVFDPTIVISNSEDAPSVKHQFCDHFNRFAEQQNQEMMLLNTSFIRGQIWIDKGILNAEDHTKKALFLLRELLKDPLRASRTLEYFEERELLLDQINTLLINCAIQSSINLHCQFLSGVKQYSLILMSLGITRFPKSLFIDPSLQDFWRSVAHLDCSYNNLVCLPDTIGDYCSNLKSLIVSNNHLKNLPESLKKCQKLEVLDCSTNGLKDLPDLSVCSKLQYLMLNGNYFTSLPSFITDNATEQWLASTLKCQRVAIKKDEETQQLSLMGTFANYFKEKLTDVVSEAYKRERLQLPSEGALTFLRSFVMAKGKITEFPKENRSFFPYERFRKN